MSELTSENVNSLNEATNQEIRQRKNVNNSNLGSGDLINLNYDDSQLSKRASISEPSKSGDSDHVSAIFPTSQKF